MSSHVTMTNVQIEGGSIMVCCTTVCWKFGIHGMGHFKIFLLPLIVSDLQNDVHAPTDDVGLPTNNNILKTIFATVMSISWEFILSSCGWLSS